LSQEKLCKFNSTKFFKFKHPQSPYIVRQCLEIDIPEHLESERVVKSEVNWELW